MNIEQRIGSVIILLIVSVTVTIQSTSTTDNTPINCPPDSVPTSNDDCECQREKCPLTPKSCPPGLFSTITRNGSNSPGECCDLYECLPNSPANCSNVHCPEIPQCPPDSYRLPGLKTMGECCAVSLGCQCLPNCEDTVCPAGTTPTILVEATGQPGRCCSLYECQKLDAPEEGRGCLLTHGNHYLKHGTNWTSLDFCTTCTCQDGENICNTFACTPCLRPIKVDGQCCPRCDDETRVQPAHCPPMPNCTEPCSNGMVKDKNDCFTCQCRDCPIDCRYEINSKDERICDCETKRKPISDGVRCRKLENCEKVCSFGLRKDANDCDTCECEQCTKVCSRGYILANEQRNALCKCKPWNIFVEGNNNIDDSMPCKTDHSGQTILRDDGELWLDGNGRQCSCVSGHEMCSLSHCSPQSDVNRFDNSTGDYCSSNPDDRFTNERINQILCGANSNGVTTVHGETISFDRCVQCVCHHELTLALCRVKECPPVACPRPRPPNDGECCPSCDPSNDFDNDSNNYSAVGEKCDSSSTGIKLIREGPCVSCRCVKNNKYCYTEHCDVLNACKRSFTVKGRCCPICIDNVEKYKSVSRCQYSNRTYDDNSEWIVDDCKKCKCILGQVVCSEHKCTVCANPIREAGRCCPVCEVDEETDSNVVQEIFYMAALFVVVIVGVALAVCVTRHWRNRKQQIRLNDSSYLTPQYQYKCVSNSPYDDRNSPKIISSDKTLLASV